MSVLLECWTYRTFRILQCCPLSSASHLLLSQSLYQGKPAFPFLTNIILQSQDFPSPNVQPLGAERIQYYCVTGLRSQVVVQCYTRLGGRSFFPSLLFFGNPQIRGHTPPLKYSHPFNICTSTLLL